MKAALDVANPVRGNLFAAAIRELIGFTLDSMAPESETLKCKWFVQEKNTKGPTRKQKFSYICHKGLMPEYLERDLLLNIEVLNEPLSDAFKMLHKATHVRPGSVLHQDDEVRQLVHASLHAVLSLFEAAETCHAAVCDALATHLSDAILDKLMGEVHGSLDELSTHTRVSGHYLEQITISRIDHATIVYSVDGVVEVDLQYGSDSDVRNDIGATMSDEYPYSARLKAEVQSPGEFDEDETLLEIDNSSFFE